MFVRAQNWQGINDENAKKCSTDFKVAHIRLILELDPQHLIHSHSHDGTKTFRKKK